MINDTLTDRNQFLPVGITICDPGVSLAFINLNFVELTNVISPMVLVTLLPE